MKFGRLSLLLSFALLGFIVGMAVYLVFDWFVIDRIIPLMSIRISQIVRSPWFIAGLAGAILSTTIVFAFAQSSES